MEWGWTIAKGGAMQHGRNRFGFTMAELTVCFAAFAVLTGLVSAVGMRAKHAADVRAAKAGMDVLADAVERYIDLRGRLPRDIDGDGDRETNEIISQLRDWDLLPESFKPVDPWGNEFIIALREPSAPSGPSYAGPTSPTPPNLARVVQVYTVTDEY
jgi:hypothetical protein